MPIVLVTSDAHILSLEIQGPSSVDDKASATYAAFAVYSNGVRHAIAPTWSLVSNPIGASINVNGLLVVPDVGQSANVVVQADYFDQTTFSATLNVVVNDVFGLSSLSITGLDVVDANSDTTVTLIAVAAYSDSSSQAVVPVWAIIGEDFGCTIDSSGVITIPKQSAEKLITVNASYTELGVTVSQQFAITLTATSLPVPKNCSLFTTGDLTMAQDNLTFLDSSSNALTITNTGSVGQGSVTPFSPYWSLQLDGSDAIGSASAVLGDQLKLYGAKLTLEMWIKPAFHVAANAWYTTLFSNQHPAAVNGRWSILMLGNSGAYTSGKLVFSYTTSPSTGSSVQRALFDIPLGQWTHVTLTVDCTLPSAATVKLYVNGVGESFTVDLSSHVNAASPNWWIGGGVAGASYFQGHISNVRAVGGLVYTSNFVPPTKPLAAINNTWLLACNSPKFGDSSPNLHPFTYNATPYASPTSPFSNAQVPYSPSYSTYFDGNAGVYLQVASTTNLGLGSSDFTFEFWVMSGTQYPNTMKILRLGTPASLGAINIVGSSNLTFFSSSNGTSYNIASSSQLVATIVPGTWYHVAICRNGNTLKTFVDGTVKAVIDVTGISFPTSNPIYLGWDGADTYRLKGLLSNVRLVVGTALYTSNFTAPTSELTAIANTKLLTCQSLTIVDNSPNAMPIQQFGSNHIAVLKHSPFAASWQSVTSTYDPTVHGGSVYFDGTSGSYLSTAQTNVLTQSGDFDIEFWICPFYSTRVVRVLGAGLSTVSGISFVIDTNGWLKLGIGTNSGYNVLSLTNIAGMYDGMWTHVAVCRIGNTVSAFANGLQTLSVSAGGNIVTNPKMVIGWDTVSTADAYRFTGFIAGLKYKTSSTRVNGFTPGGLPDTTGAAFLPRFANAGVYDLTQINAFRTLNGVSAQILSRQGTGSLYFDGSNDYLVGCSRPEYNQLSGCPFTIEFWIRPLSYGGTGLPVLGCNVTANNGWRIQINASSIVWVNNGVESAINWPIELSIWSHFAFVYTGTQMNLYKNGQKVVAANASWTNNSDPLYVGAITSGSSKFSGYLDSIRFSYGETVYTSDFDVSSPSFTAIDKTTNNKRLGTHMLLKGDGGTADSFADFGGQVVITNNGGAYEASVNPYGQFWSTYFDGNTDSLTAPASSNWNFNTGDFTVECWIRMAASPSANGYHVVGTADPWFGNNGWAIRLDPASFYLIGGGAGVIGGPSAWRIGRWTHIAVCRTGSTYKLFVDGAQILSGAGGRVPDNDNTHLLQIGCHSSYTALGMNGQVSNLRIVKGSALYTQSFDVPTSKLTAVAGTVLLVFQDNLFKDNGPNSVPLTQVGTPQIKPIDPFVGNLVQEEICSAYFNGSSYLWASNSANYAFGTGDFTVEIWAYPVSSSNARITNRLLGGYTSGTWGFGFNSGSGVIYFSEISSASPPTISGSFTCIPNTWYHVVAVRASGVLSLFVNGKRVASGAFTNNLLDSASALNIGGNVSDGYFTGFMSDLRIVKGIAVYDPNSAYITVPFTHLTAVTGTQILVLQANGLTDGSSNAVTVTSVGSTLGSFSPLRAGSIVCKSGTYLTTNTVANLNNTDWTIEAWAYCSAYAAGTMGVVQSQQGKNNWVQYASIGVTSSGLLTCCINAVEYQSTTKVLIGSWTHVALVRSGGVVTLYCNGQATSVSRTDNIDSANLSFFIGRTSNAPGGGSYIYDWQGYLSNVLIATEAMYSAAFTVPTSQLQLTAGTKMLLRGNGMSIYDATSCTLPKALGSGVTNSTTAVKYGTHSTFFAGTGYLAVERNPVLTFDGDFTIEFWGYQTNRTSANCLYSAAFCLDLAGAGLSAKMYFTVGNDSTHSALNVTNTALTGWAISIAYAPGSLNAWHHYAITRNGSIWKIWVDGVQVATATYSGAVQIPSSNFGIGYAGSADSYWVGYIDNFKITIGESLYNTTFTPA